MPTDMRPLSLPTACNLRADAVVPAHAPQPQTCSGSPGLAVKSTDLLQGQKVVAITHNGLTYRLQATRLGKLILTK